MKIGIVCYPTYGGSGVVATELGKALAQKGHKVHFISYRAPARLDGFVENVYYHEVSFADYPLFERAPYETALSSKIVDVAKFEQLDLLHVHYAIPHAATAYMAKQILKTQGIDLPYITTLHGTDITLVGKDPTYAPVVTFSINQSDGVTAVSENLKEQTYQNFNISPNIEVIPNFVDLRRFRKAKKEHFKKAIAPNGEKILIHTSNFRKVKRTHDVVLIFQKVHEQIPSKLLLVGDGPERQNLEILSRDLNISEDIRFLGKQDPVEELLAVSDLFLMPSETESFGLAALEAMACQVPVIASNAGGIPEIILHGVTGFMSSVGDVDDMSKNAIAILSNEDLLNRMKHQALQHSLKYDIEKILPIYEAYYKKVLQKALVAV
ncbi:MAG: N-acetyl-alpha-D-glucosaminyl L-malate synthase BshA [Chitinophagales bacterium]|jgi:N-acetyl-alpha-D-glucosaminyl L-malate synthase BshA|nr:N-acetyl-alpha-D-glucosaminyl L-malate synthase BshA [Chitinophagales bacterium]